MLLAVKKIILAILLPVVGFFSFSARESLPPATPVLSPEAISETSAPPPIMPQSPAPATKAAAASIPLDALKNCLGQAGLSGNCLDRIFREFLKTHSTSQALAIVQRYEDEDTTLRLSCHPVVHAVGRETFRLTGTVHDSFAACDQTCHSGCYHGAMERFLRGGAVSDDEAGHISEAELREKAVAACDPREAVRFRFQCLHGLGHALMFFLDYNLVGALRACDQQSDGWSRSSCYGGVFMENVFSATPQKRDLSATDYHYPCNKLDPQYRSDCYMMQTTRMTEMGLSTPRLFEECRKAGVNQHTCMQSIGRDLSNNVRIGDPRLVAQKCELGTDEERRACTRGVVYALVDNTWDGRYAFPFCAAFEDAGDAAYCFSVSIGYLRGTFEKQREALLADCAKFSPQSPACRDEGGR